MPNISRSNGSQTTKFGQLIECSTRRNIFLEKSYAKCGGEISPRPFSKKPNLAISLHQWSRVLYNLFLLYGNVSEDYRNILKLTCRPLVLTSYCNFWIKICLLLYGINWPNFIVWLPLLCEILSNMRIAIVCKLGCDAMNFEVKLIFLTKSFFLHDQKVVTKT